MKRLGYLIIIAMAFSLGMAFEQSRLSSIVEEGAAFVVKSTRQQVREIADLDTRMPAIECLKMSTTNAGHYQAIHTSVRGGKTRRLHFNLV